MLAQKSYQFEFLLKFLILSSIDLIPLDKLIILDSLGMQLSIWVNKVQRLEKLQVIKGFQLFFPKSRYILEVKRSRHGADETRLVPHGCHQICL